MSFMKISGLLCLVLVAYFISRAYSQYREQRLGEVDALYRVLLCVREDIRLFHTFRPLKNIEEYQALVKIGFVGKEDVQSDLLTVIPKMNLLSGEKKMLEDVLSTFGEGNVESEMEKVEKLIYNVNNILQKEEKEGKKSRDTVRIVLFTIALSLVILLL